MNAKKFFYQLFLEQNYSTIDVLLFIGVGILSILFYKQDYFTKILFMVAVAIAFYFLYSFESEVRTIIKRRLEL
jgi:hypothetical protein